MAFPKSNLPFMKNIQNYYDEAVRRAKGGSDAVNNPDSAQVELPQWLQLQMNAADLANSGGGGGGGSYSSISVPSVQPQIDNLNAFLEQGKGIINTQYGQLNTQLNQGVTDTQNLADTTTGRVGQSYSDALKANDETLAKLQLQQQKIAGTAGPSAAGVSAENIAALQSEIARQKANLESAKGVALGNQNSYGGAIVNAARQQLATSGINQTNMVGDFTTKIGQQIAQLNAQYQKAAQQAALENARNAARARSSGGGNANKAQAAKMKLLADYLKGQEKDQKNQKTPTKGIGAVISAARSLGSPELANTFTDLVDQARKESNIVSSQGKRVSMSDRLGQLIEDYAGQAPTFQKSHNPGFFEQSWNALTGASDNKTEGDSPDYIKAMTDLYQGKVQNQAKLQRLLGTYLGDYQ